MNEPVALLDREAPKLAEPEIGLALSHANRSIESYVARCRARLPSFVESHFSLEQTWKLQRRTLWRDLVCAPINSAWALPYVAVQKVAELVDRVGYLRPARWAKHLPSGISTGYQLEIERLICMELLEWDRTTESSALPQGFVKELDGDPALREFVETLRSESCDRKSSGKLTELLRQFSSGRAIVSDVAGTALTLLMSWATFGNTTLSLRGIAYGVAKQGAHDRAASKFFLGKKLGSHFYDVFPPAVHERDVWMILVVLVIGLTVAAMACTILSDPLRKVLGFHRNRLEVLLNDMERELIVLTHKSIMRR